MNRDRRIKIWRYNYRLLLAQLAESYFGYDSNNVWTLPDVHIWRFNQDGWPVIPFLVTFPVHPGVRLTQERIEDFLWHLRQRTGIVWDVETEHLAQGFLLVIDRTIAIQEDLDETFSGQSERLIRHILKGLLADDWDRRQDNSTV